jgi:predicted negative regulator of RcsB-dependent stress response
MTVSLWTTIAVAVLSMFILPGWRYVSLALSDLRNTTLQHAERITTIQNDVKDQKLASLSLHEMMVSIAKEVSACSAMLQILLMGKQVTSNSSHENKEP